MYEILKKRTLAENVNEYIVHAPAVARHCLAGQFIILRIDEEGERVPFTICDYDREAGTVSILVQTIGYTTAKLAMLNEGDKILDFAGPLGLPTDLKEYNRILLVGGGIGTAVIFPQAKQRAKEGHADDVIIGARNYSLIMYDEEIKPYCKNLYIMTDDGTKGEKGLVTAKIQSLLDGGEKYDAVFAVGPLPMMKAVCNLTRNCGIKTVVSMNWLMVDGTGMCGCCRLTVGGEIKYACIDGPEFDGHLVDFDEAIFRSKFYIEQEKAHMCRLRG